MDETRRFYLGQSKEQHWLDKEGIVANIAEGQ